jgi:phosphate/sulfate permease
MDVVLSLPVLVGLIVVALAFDFLNGLHDAANSIATIVSTRVLRPQYAVAWAAFFNFIAFLFFGLHVANTLGTGSDSTTSISLDSGTQTCSMTMPCMTLATSSKRSTTFSR